MTKEEILALFTTGKMITQESMEALVGFLEAQKGPKGDTGEQGLQGVPGTDGKDGAEGLSVKAIALTKDEAGVITGGTATLSDDSTVAITVA